MTTKIESEYPARVKSIHELLAGLPDSYQKQIMWKLLQRIPGPILPPEDSPEAKRGYAWLPVLSNNIAPNTEEMVAVSPFVAFKPYGLLIYDTPINAFTEHLMPASYWTLMSMYVGKEPVGIGPMPMAGDAFAAVGKAPPFDAATAQVGMLIRLTVRHCGPVPVPLKALLYGLVPRTARGGYTIGNEEAA